jgi:hypothetical protein
MSTSYQQFPKQQQLCMVAPSALKSAAAARATFEEEQKEGKE